MLVSSMAYAAVVIGYFLLGAGFIYDLIVEPPSMGKVVDAHGNLRPQAFMTGKINGQYINEGLASSFMFAFAAMGFIAVEMAGSTDRIYKPFVRNTLFIAGWCAVLVSVGTLQLFMSYKLP